jgi:hypothetical protein
VTPPPEAGRRRGSAAKPQDRTSGPQPRQRPADQPNVSDDVLKPQRVWSRSDVLATAAVPAAPGVYGWYFKEVPPGVPTAGCVTHGDRTLLYVGISPKRPPFNGGKPSSQNLRTRIRYHYRGNAEGSTLRLTLGCLLSERLGVSLWRVGSGTRLTFSDGEQALSQWMEANAFVCWMVTPQPWLFEEQLIRSVSLPLNLDQNQHSFCSELSARRRAARETARLLPVRAQ